MILSEAKKYFRVWSKWYWPCHCILEATFGTKIPESFLPYRKEILEEALNTVAKYYFDNGNHKASTDIQNMIVYIWLYTNDNEALGEFTKTLSNPKTQEVRLIFIDGFRNSWSTWLEKQYEVDLEHIRPEKVYLIGGKQELINNGKPYYGTKEKMLDNIAGKWEMVLLLCEPSFKEPPTEVNEETFIETMVELGVSEETISDFINYEVNWED